MIKLVHKGQTAPVDLSHRWLGALKNSDEMSSSQ